MDNHAVRGLFELSFTDQTSLLKTVMIRPGVEA